MMKEFAQSVDAGLSQSEKTLPSKYFYDKNGDALFVEIMKMPEYYLTRSGINLITCRWIFQKMR